MTDTDKVECEWCHGILYDRKDMNECYQCGGLVCQEHHTYNELMENPKNENDTCVLCEACFYDDDREMN